MRCSLLYCQFMEVDEVPLAPEAACVGLDIRVVGNDSGEKVRRDSRLGAPCKHFLLGPLAPLPTRPPSYWL